MKTIYKTLLYTYELHWRLRWEKRFTRAEIIEALSHEEATGEQYLELYSGENKAEAEAAYRREKPAAALYGGSWDELIINWVALEKYDLEDDEEIFLDVLKEKYPAWNDQKPRTKTRDFINHTERRN